MCSAGANMWRSTGDITDNWKSIKSLTQYQLDDDCYGATVCYNDMDMLVVGMYGKGNAGLGGCNDIEYKSPFCFSFYAATLLTFTHEPLPK
jgi:alpha-galactosidase